MKNRCLIICILAIFMTACSESDYTWTDTEKTIIDSCGGGMMRVLRTDNNADSTLLRTKSTDIAAEDFSSPELQTLISGMLATVQDTVQPGVGIAAPQVGIFRRLIIVQRFDKSGEPFEPYLNPRITWYSDSLRTGGEGCLSVPDIYGKVTRPSQIVVEFDKADGSGRVSDTVSGFTAVIFQHEADHLDGILFTDRMTENLK